MYPNYNSLFSHCQVAQVEFRKLYQYAQNIRGDIVFYDRFAYLCKERGISVSRAAMEAGISKSLVTKWKTNSIEIPSPDVLQKLSKYFSIPISALLGEESPETAPSAQRNTVSDEDIQFALFGGNDAITEAMYEEVKQFAAFIKQREGYQK